MGLEGVGIVVILTGKVRLFCRIVKKSLVLEQILRQVPDGTWLRVGFEKMR